MDERNKENSAINIIKKTFQGSFNKDSFVYFIKNLLNHIDETKAFHARGYVQEKYKKQTPIIKTYERIGTYIDSENKKIDVLIVYLQKNNSIDRARTTLRNFVADYLKGRGAKDAALVAFVSPNLEDWRFSLVKMDYQIDTSKKRINVKQEFTPARRFSFLVGENESSHTAQSRLVPILINDKDNPTLKELEDAFSIEKVTKEFFGRYRDLFLELKESLEDIVSRDKKIRIDFKEKNVDTTDFAKKLLGQIIFLYFLQKKGWFGVERNSDWGTGPKNFLRLLFEKKIINYDNFFNDILEPLFYEALRNDRSHDDHYFSYFKCKIPFLNGGLFDPLNDYDWSKTDILLSDKIFSNKEKTKEGDKGNGILDIFDRYNFTVKEDEPLEKEVAVDPEMLGKVFENLLKAKDRKSKGTYYTPREIVHYMCQQSLINYLYTEINQDTFSFGTEKDTEQSKLFGKSDPKQIKLVARAKKAKEIIPRKDMELFIKHGEAVAEHEAEVNSRGKETKTYSYKLPRSIRNNVKIIDEKLEAIRVCDPAVGSGAFLVGMMNEIVRSRNVLTSYFNKKKDRTIYNFKRHAIQNCLYGVDIDSGAVEIAKLRLWLSLIVDEEDIKQIKPLPNLDYKIVCGNSLLGVERDLLNFPLFDKLEELKPLFFNETNNRKKQEYKNQINELINKVTNGHKDFDFEIYFSEVFHEKKGFDVVIANPPYNELRDLEQKEQEEYKNSPYCKYALGGRVNLFQFFYPLAITISKISGIISLITQNSILAEDSALNNRRFIVENSRIIRFVSFPERDNPKKRVFENVKMSVCIGILEKIKSIPPDYNFYIVVWRDRYFNQGHVLNLRLSEIKSIFPNKLVFPISTEISFKILKKVKQRKDVFYLCTMSGEIDITKFKDKFNLSKIGYRVLTGAQVLRYKITDSPSQGEVIYLDANLSELSIDKRKDIANERIVMQRITGVDSKVRLIMTIVSKNILCANSINYIADDSNQNIRYILGVLNSTLINYYFKQTSTNTNITTAEINNIPIPKISKSKQNHLSSIVDYIFAVTKSDDYLKNEAKQKKVKEYEHQINQLVYKLYGLTPEEIKVVENNDK